MKENQYCLPTQPQNIFQLIKTGLKLWKLTANQTLVFALMYTIYNSLSVILLNGLGLYLYSVYYWLVLSALTIIGFIFTMSIAYRINQYVNNRNVSFKQVVIVSYKKSFSLILSLVIILSMLFLSLAAEFCPEKYLFIKCILYIVGIIGMVMFFYSVFLPFVIITTEGKNIKEAIKRSFQLVNGNWWYTVVSILIIQVILLFGVSIGFKSILVLTLGQSFINNNKLVFNIISQVTHIFTIPCSCACLLAIFYELQSRNDTI